MHPDSDGKKKKRPYITPTITKLSPEKANRFIVERTHCSNEEAVDLLESLRREQQPEKQAAQSSADGGRRKRLA
jgi:hypothetical protein